MHVLTTGPVAEDLHLDVPGLDDRLLQEHRGVAESRLGLAHRGLDRLPQRGPVLYQPHTATTTTGDGLDEQREAQLLGRLDQRVHVG